MPTPPTPTGEVGDSVTTIAWDTRGLLDYYTFYNIERSSDGEEFHVINESPFAFASQGDYKGTMVYYKDSLPDNDYTYYYRIRGLSFFDVDAPVSDFVEVTGIPSKFNLDILAPDFYINQEDEVVVLVHIPEDNENVLTGYNVYRKKDERGEGIQLNTGVLPISDTIFVDPSPWTVGFYYTELIDINGNTYESVYTMIQLDDDEPPAIPSGLNGSISDDGQVEISWTENTEPDLVGYKVYTSNEENGTYTEVTSTHVKENQYSYFITTNTLAEDIFYKVLAFDNRDNYSDMSAPLTLARPDHIPPSAPLLYKLVGKNNGIELGWELSQDEDVVIHYVQRKKITASKWENVLIIDDNNPAPTPPSGQQGMNTTSWIDDDEHLEPGWYHYRIVAIDEADNASASQLKKVKTHISRVMKGEFMHFSAVRLKPSQIPPYSVLKHCLSPSIKNKLHDLIANDNGTSQSSSTVAEGGQGQQNGGSTSLKGLDGYEFILMRWGYEVEASESPESFEIYKSASASYIQSGNGSTTLPSNTLSVLEEFNYPFALYRNISHEITSIVASYYNYDGYMYIDVFKKPIESSKVDIDYSYKLLGKHSLGRYSPFSASVEVMN